MGLAKSLSCKYLKVLWMFYNTNLKVMFFPNLVSNSLMQTEVPPGSSSQREGIGPAGCWKAREGVSWAWWGLPSAPGPLNLQPQAPPPCPTPHPVLPAGGLLPGSWSLPPCVSLALRPHGLAAPAPPSSSGLSVQDDRLGTGLGPCLPGPQHTFPMGPCMSGQKTWKAACHVYTFTSQICLQCYNSNIFSTYMFLLLAT